MMENFKDTKDYLGVIFPIAISAVGTSLMALVSAKAAGDNMIVLSSLCLFALAAITVLSQKLLIDTELKKNNPHFIFFFLLHDRFCRYWSAQCYYIWCNVG